MQTQQMKKGQTIKNSLLKDIALIFWVTKIIRVEEYYMIKLGHLSISSLVTQENQDESKLKVHFMFQFSQSSKALSKISESASGSFFAWSITLMRRSWFSGVSLFLSGVSILFWAEKPLSQSAVWTGLEMAKWPSFIIFGKFESLLACHKFLFLLWPRHIPT